MVRPRCQCGGEETESRADSERVKPGFPPDGEFYGDDVGFMRSRVGQTNEADALGHVRTSPYPPQIWSEYVIRGVWVIIS